MIGTTLNQRFTLDAELGRGGMGAVYRATDQVLGRSVAIKVLKEQSSDEVNRRIRVEAQILARLVHDNVVRLYDFGEAGGTCFLVMEEVDGTSYLKRWRRLALVERLRVLTQVADALDYAHHQGVIHRDVKPANVLLTAADQPKLSDFGLSVTIEQSDETGSIRGTPHYMSPEQSRGVKLDHRTDLYSLGVMVYESATGLLPFTGKPLAVISQHISAKPEPPRLRNPELSEELSDLILRLLEKDPDRRPRSGAEVARALRAECEREFQRLGQPTVDLVAGAAAATASGGTPTVAAGTGLVRKDQEEEDSGSVLLLSPATPRGASPLVRKMLDAILAEPIALTPDERYLCGHYLAYLLGGSRRRGIFLRRPLDPRNADRARLLLAMTSVMLAGGTDASVARAAELLEARPDVRPALSPIVVAKYLATRDTPGKRKKFRQVRKKLQEASPYGQAHLLDRNGLLNPGLMPGTIDDLRKIAPERTEVDDQLIARWNRVAEVWRDNPGFRAAVLRYATRNAAGDPCSADLWPEVVYPLIERARWQRRSRSRAEALWDNVCANVLHVPDAGVKLDRAFHEVVPPQVVAQLDLDAALDALEDEPQLEAEAPAAEEADRLTARIDSSQVSLDALVDDQAIRPRGPVPLATPDPHRFLLGELRSLWEEAIASMRAGKKATTGHRLVPVGPYRLVVIPSVRGRSASQVAIQGMPNKQIEMLTPSIRLASSASKPFVAVWLYQDNSLVASYLDFKGSANYILWHAPNAQQFNFEDPGALNHMLYTLGMEVPDQLDRALSRRFRPKNAV